MEDSDEDNENPPANEKPNKLVSYAHIKCVISTNYDNYICIYWLESLLFCMAKEKIADIRIWHYNGSI